MNNYDLTIISNLNVVDGIGRQGIGLLSCLKDELKINTLLIQPANYKDIPKDLMPIVAKPFNNQYGKVSFWTYILGLNENLIKLHASLQSEIKIAYSMFESDQIPQFWADILNKHYDLVVVPDEWLVNVYKNSGVKIPIFVLPLGIWLEDFLAQPIKTKQNFPFTFGMTGSFIERKNHLHVFNAFRKLYKDNPKFKLKLHGRFGPIKEKIEREIDKHDLSNVELLSIPFSKQEYLEWFKSLDCYVFPSMGEGFSITPREAMALGIPTIVTNNSAQQTIANSGFVCSINSKIKKPAIYEYFGKQRFGNVYDCYTDELMTAMEKIVENYNSRLLIAKNSRYWIERYLWNNLRLKYLSLIKPNNVAFGTQNKIEDDCIIISDQKLYEKYRKAFIANI